MFTPRPLCYVGVELIAYFQPPLLQLLRSEAVDRTRTILRTRRQTFQRDLLLLRVLLDVIQRQEKRNCSSLRPAVSTLRRRVLLPPTGVSSVL